MFAETNIPTTMNRWFILFVIFAAPSLSNKVFSQQPKHVYCQIIANEKFLSNKVTVELDFGQKMNFFSNNRLKDENGKTVVFNTVVDAMNYMGKRGWEFGQSNIMFVDNGMGSTTVVYIVIMKKLFDELDDDAKSEYLKEFN